MALDRLNSTFLVIKQIMDHAKLFLPLIVIDLFDSHALVDEISVLLCVPEVMILRCRVVSILKDQFFCIGRHESVGLHFRHETFGALG